MKRNSIKAYDLAVILMTIKVMLDRVVYLDAIKFLDSILMLISLFFFVLVIVVEQKHSVNYRCNRDFVFILKSSDARVFSDYILFRNYC